MPTHVIDDNHDAEHLEFTILENDDNDHSQLSFSDVFKNLTGLSLPMALSYTFSFQLVLLVYALSQLNDDEENVASIALITSLINTIVVVGISPLFSMSMVAGREIGELQEAEEEGEAEDALALRREHISGINRNGLLVSSVMAPLMTAGMVFSKPLLTNIFGQNEEVASLTQAFVRPYALSIPSVMVRLCSEQVMFSFGRSKPAMLMAVTNFVGSMALGGAFAFGAFGLPKLGKEGLLIGCIGESYLTALTYSLYIAKHRDFQSYAFFNFLKPMRQYVNQLKDMLKLGSSFLFSFATETSLALITSALAGMVGTKEQAAYSATMQFALLTLLLQAAFSQSTCQEMSRELGSRHYLNVHRLGKYSLPTTLCFIAPIPFLFSCDPKLLMSVLGLEDESIQQILTKLVPIMSAGCIGDAVRFNLLQQLRILDDAKAASLTSTGALALGVATSAILGLKTNMGVYGVATGFTGGIALANAGLFYRWQRRIQPAVIQARQQQILSENEVEEQTESQPLVRRNCFSFFNRLSQTRQHTASSPSQNIIDADPNELLLSRAQIIQTP